MPLPVLAGIAIGTSIVSGVAGFFAKSNAEKKRAEALEQNALVRLSAQLSGLGAREQEELANARQARRLGRRQSAVLEARARAGGADAGVGSGEQVQDVGLGLSEFLGSVDENLARTRSQIQRGRIGADREFRAARKAAKAGVGGPAADFMDFLNIGVGALNTFSNFSQPSNSFQGQASGNPGDVFNTGIGVGL